MCRMQILRKFFEKKSWSQMIQKCLGISARNGKKKIRLKMAVFGGSGGSHLQNHKKRVCYHKTKFLTVITHPLTLKINPDNTVYANVSDLPPTPQKLKTSI